MAGCSGGLVSAMGVRKFSSLPFLPASVDLRRRQWLASASGLGLAVAGGGLLSGLSGCASQPVPPAGVAGRTEVPAFSRVDAGEMPEGWVPYIVRRDRELTQYGTSVVAGRTVLHAVADGARSGLHCPVNIDARTTPWLRWQWRVDAVNPEATVGDDDAEDTPARLVVAFDGDLSKLSLRDQLFYDQVQLFTGNVLPYATLTYVWDGRLPVGQVLPYARTSRIQYQVVESGVARQGQWLSYERDVAQDFQAIFGEAPGRIIDVGVLTDSDDLKDRIEAWYGDISFHGGPLVAR
ncbi:MAG: DUF3047 domain-containing protein [Rubrivivax sp.]|nr:MAG: DUF3047 domain-containing protein [Rubrivivax sp.]